MTSTQAKEPLWQTIENLNLRKEASEGILKHLGTFEILGQDVSAVKEIFADQLETIEKVLLVLIKKAT